MGRRNEGFCGLGKSFLAIAGVEAIIGWTEVAGAATAISWLLCGLFLVVAVLRWGAMYEGWDSFADEAASLVAGWHEMMATAAPTPGKAVGSGAPPGPTAFSTLLVFRIILARAPGSKSLG
jgi:hypothetical protein